MSKKENNNLLFTGVIIGIIILVFVFLIVLKGPKKATTSTVTSYTDTNSVTGTVPAPSSVTNAVANVSESTLTTIGLGTILAKPSAIKAPALTNNNKPEILYQGAEYCPYCATERWAMTVALDKFGSFTNLSATHSSTSDVYPNTQTLSYYGSTYVSKYISFVPIEVYTNIPSASGGYTSLQTPTNAQNNLINKYDSPPYVPSGSAGSIPFIDFGGKYIISGASYSPTVLQGQTIFQISSALNNPKSPIAQGADGTANAIIATICSLTNNQPSNVCNPTIQAIEKQL